MSYKPVRQLPDKTWHHYSLYRNVREALYSLPAYFKSETTIAGLSATDIFTLNTVLGATIENHVVESLNQMRIVWDPDGKYSLFKFVRQAQTFPDVLLVKIADKSWAKSFSNEIIMGIELKGWYMLAKEGEPSFRYKVTSSACAIQDLIVVVPWALSNVIVGTPRIFTPFVESAKYAAEFRNYWWACIKKSQQNTGVRTPTGVSPYPNKSDQIADEPERDQGGNFGRFSRTGLMDDYLSQTMSELLCGIKADYWRFFFKLFQDQKDENIIAQQIAGMKTKIETDEHFDEDKKKAILQILEGLERLI